MADARILHKRAGNGERLCAVSDFEFRVWAQYILSSDDYGVMRASATVLQADNPRLERAPVRAVQRALDRLVAIELLASFEHQQRRYVWQLDWQDFQQIRYPRDTVNPCPSAAELARATASTQELFSRRGRTSRERKGNSAGETREVSDTVPGTAQEPARAGGRETLTLTQTLPDLGSEDPEEIPISTVPPAWRQNGSRRDSIGGAEAFHRRNCAPWALDACAAGLCVPKYLWPQWERRQPHDVLRAFIAAWTPRAAGDAPEKFWPAAFEQHFGVAIAGRPQTREQRILAAGQRVSDSIAKGEL